MIVIQFLIQKNKFELIWSCILKVVIFSNFLEISGIFLNLFNSIFYFKIITKNKKGFLLPRADVAEHSHVTTRGHVFV